MIPQRDSRVVAPFKKTFWGFRSYKKRPRRRFFEEKIQVSCRTEKTNLDFTAPRSSRPRQHPRPSQPPRPEISQWSTRSKWFGGDSCSDGGGLRGAVCFVCWELSNNVRVPQCDLRVVANFSGQESGPIRNGLTLNNTHSNSTHPTRRTCGGFVMPA